MRDTAARQAANALRKKAKLLTLDFGRVAPSEWRRRAEILTSLADGIEQSSSAAAVRACGTAKDREVAATEVYSAALRRAASGSVSIVGTPTPKGWVPSGADMGGPINPYALRDAVGLYDIALALSFDEFWAYSKGLLLERLSDYEAAAKTFESLKGHYAKHSGQHAQRCRQKMAGTYDSQGNLSKVKADIATRYGQHPEIVETLSSAFDEMQSYADVVAGDAQRSVGASPEAGSDENETAREEAVCVAQRFVHYLVAGAFDRACDLLRDDLAETDAEELSQRFREMTLADLDGATTDDPMICVMSVDVYPHMTTNGLGSVYVAISGEQYNEAVCVIVTRENGEARISEIEWGRP